MNERYAADPQSCESSTDFQLLVLSFGSFSGRYLVKYPDNWETRVREHFVNAQDMEKKKVEVLLVRASRELTLEKFPLDWEEQKSWSDNAWELLSCKPAKLDGMIIRRNTDKPSKKAYTLDDLILPRTSGERIFAKPEEYVRVTETMLLNSPEMVIVDPYFDLTNQNVAAIARALFEAMSKGKCSRIKCFASASKVHEKATDIQLKAAFEKITQESFEQRPVSVTYTLLDDSHSQERMHDRYLLSKYGGIHFGQGFTKRPKQKVNVDVVAEGIHRDLMKIYVEGEHDMTKRFSIST